MDEKGNTDSWDITVTKETAGLLYEALQQVAVRAPQAKALAELYNDVETAAVMTGAITDAITGDEKV